MNLDEKTYKEYDTINRYKKSIITDGFIYLILFIPIFLLSLYFSSDDFRAPMFFIVGIIWIAFNMISDKIFRGCSLGKRLYKIKIVYGNNNELVPLISIIYRRFLEASIHPLLSKMNFLEKSKYIDKMTNTKIVDKSFKTKPKESIQATLSEGGHDLYIKREKAFLIDLTIILIPLILSLLARFSYFKNILDSFGGNVNRIVTLLLAGLIVIYFVFKDCVYRNASVGKKKFGICIIDEEGNAAPRLQVVYRGFIQAVFWPFEIILFLLNKKQLAEILTNTKIYEK